MRTDLLPISIVLATYNGAKFLEQQLQSIQAQDHKLWQIILSDDRSQDETCKIAMGCINPEQLHMRDGPENGLTQNFWNALCKVPDGHYASFCDQDDVWHPDKLSRALHGLEKIEIPAVYSSGRTITDHQLNIIAHQPRRPVGPFASLLFRNPVAGHTCVFNPAAVAVLKRMPPPKNVPFHDWWCALVLKAVDARFVHDPQSSLYYRQHGRNVLGAKGGRIAAVMDRRYFGWVSANISALKLYQNQFTPKAQKALRVCLPLHAGLSLIQR